MVPFVLAPDLLTIEFRASEQLIVVRWAGACCRARLREAYDGVVALMRRTGAHRVLFDTREREDIGLEDARWVASEAYSSLLQVCRRGLRLAYAVPRRVLESYLPNQTETSGELLHIGVFRHPTAATEWLLAG